MKLIPILSFLLLINLYAKAQNTGVQWSGSTASTGGTTTIARKTHVNSTTGTIYTVGNFLGTNPTDFNPGAGTFNLVPSGGTDAFVQVLNSDGTFDNAFKFGGATLSDDCIAYSVTTSNLGTEIYVVGGFSGTVDFDPGAPIQNLTSAGDYDIFIAKLNNTGSLIWAIRLGDTSIDEAKDITIDNSDNIYIAGKFSGAVDFDPGAGVYNQTSLGTSDGFVLKLNGSSGFIGANQAGSSSLATGEGLNSISINPTGANVLVTGEYLSASADSEIIVWYLDNLLITVYQHIIGDTMNDVGIIAKLDPSTEEAYIGGEFTNTVDFDPSASVTNLISAGNTDGFIVKFDNTGGFIWALRMGGATGFETVTGLDITSSGELLALGTFSGISDFPAKGSQPAVLTNIGVYDAFFGEVSPSEGVFNWIKQLPAGAGASVTPTSIISSATNIQVAGYYDTTLDVDPEPSATTLTAGGGGDGFIVRYCPVAIFSPSEIPQASKDVPYTANISVTGFTTPTWSLIGTLPTGFTLNPATGVISGTATSDFGSVVFGVQATEGGCSVSKEYRLTYKKFTFNNSVSEEFPQDIDFAKSMVAGDFSKDGVLDLVFASRSAEICSKSGNEDNTFANSSLITSVGARGVAAFDINKDGLLDLVTVNAGTNPTISYFNGVLTAPYLTTTQTDISLGGAPLLSFLYDLDIVLADIDNDGDMDATTAGHHSYSGTQYTLSLRVLLFDSGTNTFGSPIFSDLIVSSTTTPNTIRLDAGDLNNDGFADIVVMASNNGGATVEPTIFRNDAGISFTPGIITLPIGNYNYLRDIAIADFNNDNIKDVVVIGTPATNKSQDVFHYYRNNNGSPGTFFAPTTITTSNPNRFYQIALGDFDNNDAIDVALSAKREGTIYPAIVPSEGRLAILRNDPPGTFFLDTYDNTSSINVLPITTGDFNRDGLLDIAVADSTLSNELRIFYNQTISTVATPEANNALRLRSAFSETGSTGEPLVTQTTSFTVEGWVKLSQAASNQSVFYNGQFAANGFGIFVPAGTREINIISHLGGVATTVSANIGAGDDFSDGQWNHFALGRNASGDWFFHWNGNNNTLTGVTHNFTAATTNTFFGSIDGSAGLLSDGALDEFRFWSDTLALKDIQEWMNIKANKDHPQAVSIIAHYSFNTKAEAGAFFAYDGAYKIYPPAKRKNITFSLNDPATSDINWITDIPPITNFGSSKTMNVNAGNQASIIDYDAQTGIQLLFNSTVFPSGDIVVTRSLEYPTDFPATDGVPKVYWTIRNYGTPKLFDPMDMLRIRLTQTQCDSAKINPIPLPTASNFMNYYIYKRSDNSASVTDWVLIGPANEFGSLRARRPGSTVSEFGRVLNPNVPNNNRPITSFSQIAVVHSLTPLLADQMELQGRRISMHTNELRWIHRNPISTTEIEIERSENARTFMSIGKVKAKSANEIYTFLDKKADKPYYYRVSYAKGEYKDYSNTIYIDIPNNSSNFGIAPNPLVQGDEVQILGVTDSGKWQISNSIGKVLLKTDSDVLTFEKTMRNFINSAPSGIYLITYDNGLEKRTTKLVLR
ncbi:MAG: FG-GAP-like repeat-containing protein [Thermonemataceae bacterium]|nr:FG-GAP-like repeat-containing protein [Thermonemataceae bacterium]